MPTQEMALVLGATAYRQLLRKIRAPGGAAPTEDSAVALQQAKQRVMLRLASHRDHTLRDPRRAFARLRDQVALLRDVKNSAKDSIKELGSARAARLRSAYDSLKQRSLRAVSSSPRSEEVEVIGSHGVWRVLVLGSVAAASKLFMNGFSQTTVEGEAILSNAQARPPGQPLITVSNHVAAMDDPLLLAALTPFRNVFEAGGMRWSLCATDRCFKNSLMSAFFRAGQVLPVERGKGMDQPGMRAAEQRLNAGEWVHIFPEGTRSPDGATMGPVRAGVGRLVAGCEAPPLVVPIVHDGMQNVMPRGRSLPVPGQEVRILIGEPIPVADLLRTAEVEQWPETKLYRSIADRIGESMVQLKTQLDGVSLLPAAAAVAGDMDEQQMLLMIEDELDAASHPWTASLRQTAGIPSVSSLAASSSTNIVSGVSADLCSFLIGRSGISMAGDGSSSSTWSSAAGATVSPAAVAPSWQGVADSVSAYARQRAQHVASMLWPTGQGLQPTLGL